VCVGVYNNHTSHGHTPGVIGDMCVHVGGVVDVHASVPVVVPISAHVWCDEHLGTHDWRRTSQRSRFGQQGRDVWQGIDDRTTPKEFSHPVRCKVTTRHELNGRCAHADKT
jgi:hypothetical protein